VKNDWLLLLLLLLTPMASRFILHLSAELVQPTKHELVSLTNLLWHSKDIRHGYIKYNFLEGKNHLQSYVLDGRTPNLEVLNTILLGDTIRADTVHEVLQEQQKQKQQK
jgi:hypothetical protein